MNKQLKVIVADNNAEFVTRLCTKTDWEQFGYELTGSADNSTDIIKLIEEKQPDLLFINKQLSEDEDIVKCLTEFPDLRTVIFLEPGEKSSDTGIQPFKYLVKTFSMAKMSGELRKIYRQIVEIEDGYDEYREIELGFLVASLLMNFFDQPVTDEEMITELSQYGIKIDENSQMKVLAVYSPQQGFLLADTVKEVNAVVRQYYSCGSFILGNRAIILLVSNNGFDNIDAVMDQLRTVFNEENGIKCVFGTSEPFTRSSSLLPAYFEAVESTNVSRKKLVDEISEPSDVMLEEVRNVAELDTLLISSNKAELENYLLYHLRPEVSEMGTLQILMTACTVFSGSLGESELERMLRVYELTNIISENTSLSLIKHRVFQFCMACNELLAKKRIKDNEKLANVAIDMINRYYMEEELSLNTISKYLHVTPNYLSFLIKKFKGDTFSSILIAKRMEEARKLLETSTMKVAEIAEVVGYSDQHYFSHSFKNYYGISPLKMRKKAQAEK